MIPSSTRPIILQTCVKGLIITNGLSKENHKIKMTKKFICLIKKLDIDSIWPSTRNWGPFWQFGKRNKFSEPKLILTLSISMPTIKSGSSIQSKSWFQCSVNQLRNDAFIWSGLQMNFVWFGGWVAKKLKQIKLSAAQCSLLMTTMGNNKTNDIV